VGKDSVGGEMSKGGHPGLLPRMQGGEGGGDRVLPRVAFEKIAAWGMWGERAATSGKVSKRVVESKGL